jgi:hypothetical protein
MASTAARTLTAFGRRMTDLIRLSGGTIEDGLFVTRPGCLLLAKTQLNPHSSVSTLFDSVLIDRARPPYEQFAEFNSRLTYLSFRSKAGGSSAQFNHDKARKHGHLSVFGPLHATFLLAGISVETSLELIAHSEARVARLTSSKTKAMSAPLFRLLGNEHERKAQKEFILSALKKRYAHHTTQHGSTRCALCVCGALNGLCVGSRHVAQR